MPTVTLILIDTPDGRLAVHSNFRPQPGAACSPAQSTALEIMNRTRKEWGIEPQTWDRPRSVETPEQLCAELIDFEGLGHAVTAEVRQRALRALQTAQPTIKATT